MRRPVGRMYAPYMAISSDGGALTGQQACAMVIVWAEPVAGLATSQFKVSGPSTASVGALKLLRGTSSYYHLLVNLPADYTGAVSIAFTVRFTLPLISHTTGSSSQGLGIRCNT